MRNKIPMSQYAEWRKTNKGVRVFFRGPRFPRTAYQRFHNAADCRIADATHFVVGYRR
jgi:hypothetical protein